MMSTIKKMDTGPAFPTIHFGTSRTDSQSKTVTEAESESFTQSVSLGYEMSWETPGEVAGFGFGTESSKSVEVSFSATQTESKSVAEAVGSSMAQSSELTCPLACTVPHSETTKGFDTTDPIGQNCPSGYEDDPNLYIWFWEMEIHRPWNEGAGVSVATCFTQCTCSPEPPACMLTQCGDEFCTVCKPTTEVASSEVAAEDADISSDECSAALGRCWSVAIPGKSPGSALGSSSDSAVTLDACKAFCLTYNEQCKAIIYNQNQQCTALDRYYDELFAESTTGQMVANFVPSGLPSPPPPLPPPTLPLPDGILRTHDEYCDVDSIQLCTERGYTGTCVSLSSASTFAKYTAWDGGESYERISTWVIPSLLGGLGIQTSSGFGSIRVPSGCLVRIFEDPQPEDTFQNLPSSFRRDSQWGSGKRSSTSHEGYYTDFIADSAWLCDTLKNGLYGSGGAQVWAIDKSTYIGAMLAKSNDGGEHNNNCMGYLFGEYLQVVASTYATEYVVEIPDLTTLNEYFGGGGQLNDGIKVHACEAQTPGLYVSSCNYLYLGNRLSTRGGKQTIQVMPSASVQIFAEAHFKGSTRLLNVGIYVEDPGISEVASDLAGAGATISGLKVRLDLPQALFRPESLA